jgi:multidrug efflux pump subunit AcrA (membrane-fusion protein)
VTTFLHRHRRALVPLVLAVAATIVALVYRTELAAWVRGAGARSAGVEPHAGAVASGALDPGSDGVAYYTCPMHTSVRAEGPGACPICSMPLVAVTAREVSSGVVTILADRREAFGILTTPATVAPLRRSIRAVGRVTYDETRLTDVTLKLKGWIAQLDANATGQHVRRGQRLLSLYSPELYAAQQEYLAALGSPALEGLVGAARRKLELWGMTGQQISDVGSRIAFVDIGEGRLQPVEVELGVRNAEMVEVVRGLTAGQPVVVDGNFLVAAESRIRSADFWSGHVHP